MVIAIKEGFGAPGSEERQRSVSCKKMRMSMKRRKANVLVCLVCLQCG